MTRFELWTLPSRYVREEWASRVSK
jgi:hypothetical protein